MSKELKQKYNEMSKQVSFLVRKCDPWLLWPGVSAPIDEYDSEAAILYSRVAKSDFSSEKAFPEIVAIFNTPDDKFAAYRYHRLADDLQVLKIGGQKVSKDKYQGTIKEVSRALKPIALHNYDEDVPIDEQWDYLADSVNFSIHELEGKQLTYDAFIGMIGAAQCNGQESIYHKVFVDLTELFVGQKMEKPGQDPFLGT